MSDIPRRPVQNTYSLEDLGWQNAFADPDHRPANLLRQDALSEMDKPQSPAYWSMKQNFKQIDLNGDGFLSPDEIKLAAKTDSDLAALDANKSAQFDIKRLVNDGPNDAKGISARDIQAFGAQDVAANHAKNDPAELKMAAEFLDKYFDKVNRGGDGFINKGELDQLIADPSLKAGFRQKFLLVERYFEPISELHKDRLLKVREHAGLSQDDLRVLIKNDGNVYKGR